MRCCKAKSLFPQTGGSKPPPYVKGNGGCTECPPTRLCRSAPTKPPPEGKGDYLRWMRCCTLKLLCCIISPPPANAGAPSSEGAECLICPFIKLLPFHSHHGCNLTNEFYQTLASLCRGRGTARRWWESTVLKLIRFGTDAQWAPLQDEYISVVKL